MPLILISNNGGGGDAPSDSELGTIIIPGEVVAGNVTNFPVRLELGLMPSEWWDQGIDSDGGNIRIYEGIDDSSGTPLPFDVARIDVGSNTGTVFFKCDLTTSDNYFFIAVETGETLPAYTDPIGRDEVWADYEAVFIASDTDADQNRNGNGNDLTFNGGMGVSGGLFDFDGSNDWMTATVAKFTNWSIGTSVIPENVSNLSTAVAYTDGTANSNRTAIVQAFSTQWEFWNVTDGVLAFNSGIDPANGLRVRLNITHQGTTERKAYYNGGNVATDSGVAQKPEGAGDELNIGAATSTPSELLDGKEDMIYLRNGILTANWLQTEFNSWERPEAFTFPTVTAATVIAQLVDDGAGKTTYTFADVVFGPMFTGRQIVISVAGCTDDDDSIVLDSVTIGGASATIDAQVTTVTDSRHAFVARAAPSGVSGNIVIAFSGGSMEFLICTVLVLPAPVTVYDTDTDTTTGSGTASDMTTDVDVPDGGVVVSAVVAMQPSGIDLTDITWTGTAGAAEIQDVFGSAFGGFRFRGGTAWVKAHSGGGSGLTLIATPSHSTTRLTMATVAYSY